MLGIILCDRSAIPLDYGCKPCRTGIDTRSFQILKSPIKLTTPIGMDAIYYPIDLALKAGHVGEKLFWCKSCRQYRYIGGMTTHMLHYGKDIFVFVSELGFDLPPLVKVESGTPTVSEV